jgi:hypothetical protein
MRAPRQTVRIAAALALSAPALLAGCAAKQRIPLDQCVAEKVTVYVDGRLLEPGKELELSNDVPHKMFFKRSGQQSRLVVLESTKDEAGRPVLKPEDPCQELVAIGLDRNLQLDVDDSGAEPGSEPGSHSRP